VRQELDAAKEQMALTVLHCRSDRASLTAQLGARVE